MIRANKVELEGNLGADPEIRYLPDGTAVATMRLATNEFWKTQDGERHKHTEWHRCVAWRKVAEMIGSVDGYKKGARVELEGRLRTRQWDDQNGITRYTTEVHLTGFPRLRGIPNGSAAPLPDVPDDMLNQDNGELPDQHDEIPF